MKAPKKITTDPVVYVIQWEFVPGPDGGRFVGGAWSDHTRLVAGTTLGEARTIFRTWRATWERSMWPYVRLVSEAVRRRVVL